MRVYVRVTLTFEAHYSETCEHDAEYGAARREQKSNNLFPFLWIRNTKQYSTTIQQNAYKRCIMTYIEINIIVTTSIITILLTNIITTTITVILKR